LRSLTLALLLFAAIVPLARADGDPASDWLLQRPLFVPSDAGISATDSASITALLRSARQQGYTLHVAVIPTRYDMGSVTVLFAQPRLYARFLSQELYFLYKGRVLVVMPTGYAIARAGAADRAEQAALNGLPPPGSARGAPLAAATERAIRRLATQAGVTLAAVHSPSGHGTSTARDRIVIGIVAAPLAAGALTFAVWRGSARSRRRRGR
jgi:hypothetical protein